MAWEQPEHTWKGTWDPYGMSVQLSHRSLEFRGLDVKPHCVPDAAAGLGDFPSLWTNLQLSQGKVEQKGVLHTLPGWSCLLLFMWLAKGREVFRGQKLLPYVTRAPEAPSGSKEAAKKTSNLQSKCSRSSTGALEHLTVRGDTMENEMEKHNGNAPVKKQL